MILYWPAPSVTTDRTFSINAGLAASTVTPGRTAPDVSLTTPAMDACAYAAAGSRTRHAIANETRFKPRMCRLLAQNGAGTSGWTSTRANCIFGSQEINPVNTVAVRDFACRCP